MEEVPFAGRFDVLEPDLEFFVQGGEARVVSFGSFYIGNPGVFDAGDVFLRNLRRVDANHWQAEMAQLTLEDSPTFPRDWPVSVTYLDIDLRWNGSSWEVSGAEVSLYKLGDDFDGVYDYAGACEFSFVNNNGSRLYLCEYPQTARDCRSTPGSDREEYLWAKATCADVGYEHQETGSLELGYWRDEPDSNVTPGEHGHWGDGAAAAKAPGGSSPGGTPGSQAIASCSDGLVCTEILEGDASAYQQQCAKGGDTGSLSPCAASYKGGPACTHATLTSMGQRIQANIYWAPTFCTTVTNINTYGTCCDVSGTPSGTHCRNVTTCE